MLICLVVRGTEACHDDVYIDGDLLFLGRFVEA